MRRDSSKMNNSAVKQSNSARTWKTVKNSLVHVGLAIMSIIWLFPIFWVILTSLRVENNGTGSYTSYFWPKELGFDNYVKLFTEKGLLDFPRMFMNTLIVAIFSCIVSTFFTISVAYCMSRLRFKLRKPFMNITMILGLFPGFMSMIAIYTILKTLNLTEGSSLRLAMVLVYSGGAGLGFLIAKGFFDTIPKTLDEAALIDGATKWQVFTKIIMPLSKPTIVYTVLGAFMAPWVDFIFAKVLCRTNKDYYTVSIGLWSMLEKEYVHQYFTRFCAGAVCISIPISIVFLCMQGCYKEGMSGAVKG
jgi:arabinogalactan oligomer/maltooligosaccharide transport system permease protein